MNFRIPRSLLIPTVLFCCFSFIQSAYVFGQANNLPPGKYDPLEYRAMMADSMIKQATPARLPKLVPAKNAARPFNSTGVCNTSTFYMHLKTPAGEKINVNDLQTFPDGDFMLAGTVTRANAEEEGIVCIMGNSGNIIIQQRIRVNNKPTTIYSAKVLTDGRLLLAGVVHDVTDKAFVTLLNKDLSANWLQTFNVTTIPSKVLAEMVYGGQIHFAVQLPDAVLYALLGADGTLIWSQRLVPPGLDELAGIGHDGYTQLSVLLNCTRGGKKVVEIATIDQQTGNVISAHTYKDATEAALLKRVTSFNGRFTALGVMQDNAAAFYLQRAMIYSSQGAESRYLYTIPGTFDFAVTAALDNAGDVLGVCLPKDGKLVYIRHFSYAQSSPEYIRKYDVPKDAGVAAVTRSLIDGGSLFALNTANASECILIKTDSIGLLPDCGYTDVPISYAETFNIVNTLSATTSSAALTIAVPATLSASSASFTTTTDCNKTFCPPPPAEDTCLSSYYKTLRSNSYIDDFGGYFLMGNTTQLVSTARVDRVTGDINQITYGLKLLDEKGNFIKGINVFSNGISAPFYVKQTDDRHVLLVHNVVIASTPYFTFTLVDDNLQILWSKSYKAFETFGTNGNTYNNYDIVSDKEGNYYFIANTAGIFIDPKILVFKMDGNGNQVWVKINEIQSGVLVGISATTTATSLIAVLEGGSQGSTSINLDKNSGKLLAAYQFQNNSGGAGYSRLLAYEQGKIFYAGNRNSSFAMGIFDTTGRPLKFKYITDNDGVIKRGAIVKSNKLYATYFYFNGIKTVDVLLKIDSALNIEYLSEFDVLAGYVMGMGVGDDGSVYIGGNNYYGGASGNYVDAFLKKIDANGELGTCTSLRNNLNLQELTLGTTSVGFKEEMSESFTLVNIPVNFTIDTYGQQVSQLLCGSVATCKSIAVTGPASVCKINESFTYQAVRNPGCNLKPLWVYDTASIRLQSSTDSTAIFQFKKTGRSWLKVVLKAGCETFMDSLLVQVQSAPATFSLGGDTTLCTGDSLVLAAGAGFNSYIWQDGSSASSFTVIRPGKYFVTVDNVCGNVFTDSIDITGVAIPTLHIGQDTSVCFNDTLRLQAPAGFKQYTWQPASKIAGQGLASAYIIPIQNEQVSLTVITTAGCKAYDTLFVTVKQARQLFLGNDTSFCLKDSIQIFAGNNYGLYTWSTGDHSAGITVKQAGTYSLLARDVNGCFAKDTMIVQQVFSLPSPKLGNDFNLCIGQERILNPGVFDSYLWQDGSMNPNYAVKNPGVYRVKIIDINRCTASDTVIFSQQLPRPSNFLKPGDSICQYRSLTIDGPGMFKNYLWSTGSQQQNILVTTPGKYILLVKDNNECEGSDTIHIVEKDCLSGVYIPTAFSPNGDGLNDIFKPTVYGAVSYYNMLLYNRYGEVVFASSDPQKGWDGVFKGVKQPPGVFVWQCYYQLTGFGRMNHEKGSLTLVR